MDISRNIPALACAVALIIIVGGPILAWVLRYMEQNSPEPHDQIKGGFFQESRLYKGPRGIMEAAALAESHRSGRERWQTGRVILTDNDMGDYGVSVHAQWMVDNTHSFPAWGIRIDNRLSDSPRNVNKKLFREAYKNFREIPQQPADERGYPVEIKKHERTRR